VARPSKLICIGLNYADHAKETKPTPPTEPVIFMKATSAIVGPYDDVSDPERFSENRLEVELACCNRKKASYVEEANAMEYVAWLLPAQRC
jgi:2-keto-4-pentenoate hydratase/2-oxohepta-3-ene-1,7-dioic acid hydratase in catechol pathway